MKVVKRWSRTKPTPKVKKHGYKMRNLDKVSSATSDLRENSLLQVFYMPSKGKVCALCHHGASLEDIPARPENSDMIHIETTNSFLSERVIADMIAKVLRRRRREKDGANLYENR